MSATRQIGMTSASRRLLMLIGALLAGAALLLCGASRASADAVLKVESGSNTTVDPDGATIGVSTVTQGSASPATDEVQRLEIDAGLGTYRLSFGADTTAELPFNASAPDVQAALEALPSIGAGNLAVTPAGAPLSADPPYRIAFGNALAATDTPQLIAAEGSQPLGARLRYLITIKNIGDTMINNETDHSAETRFTVTLPDGMRGVSADLTSFTAAGDAFSCPTLAGAQVFTCTGTPLLGAISGRREIYLTVGVPADADAGVVTTAFDLESDGAPLPAHTVDPITVTASPPEFGADAFDMAVTKGGAPLTTAGAHPDAQTTTIDFNTFSDPERPILGFGAAVEDPRDVIVDLPPGFVGNPTNVSQCTLEQLVQGEAAPKSLCPTASQVGTAQTRTSGSLYAFTPVYNMAPTGGAPARFGFDINGTIVLLDVRLRSDGDYGLEVVSAKIPQGLMLSGNTVTFWGVPSDPRHTPERGCPGGVYPENRGPTCPSSAPPAPFFRNPTACSAPGALTTGLRIDSWQHPGDFKTAQVAAHEPLGYPFARMDWGQPVGIDGCDQVPFEPTLDAALTSNRADSPTGLNVDIGLPSDCWEPKSSVEEAEEGVCQSDMREAEVTLPEGLSLSPSAAGGRQACSPAEIGLSSAVGSSPIHFNRAPASCPDASRIGSAEISTPLLGVHGSEGEPVTDALGKPILDPLEGSVYLARQGQNPFGSLVAIYLVVEGSGVRIKQAGEIELGSDGRIVTRFQETPQTPFANIHLELFGGPRAALRTPAACGTYSAEATLTPWSGTGAVQLSSSFQITQGCGGGFDPKLRAGTENPLAGSTAPFNLRLTREDGTQEIGSLQVKLPPGLVSSLRGYSYCPDSVLAAISAELGTGVAQEGAPSCPSSSRVGSVTIGAGAGPSPFYTNSGRAYLAGPYKGAPVSLAVVAPAVAGPFDLGSVVVRNAIRVDPSNAQLTVDSDPLPTVVHGVPLDLRDVRVRYDYTVNPTNCEPLQVSSRITSTQGTGASPSANFQVAGCDRLGFKPRLSLQLSGPTHRAAHPRLRAVLRARPGDANIGNTTVLLPKTELLENAHIRTICTRVQYAAAGGGGAGCPERSVYGYARAWTPLLDQPLQGPVYLRSNGGDRELPDLVASLDGQIHIDLVGYIDSVRARIRNRFAVVPDAPVSKFELTMQGGKKGLLANNTNLCRAKPHASASFEAQNGRLLNLEPLVNAGCGKGGKGRKR